MRKDTITTHRSPNGFHLDESEEVVIKKVKATNFKCIKCNSVFKPFKKCKCVRTTINI